MELTVLEKFTNMFGFTENFLGKHEAIIMPDRGMFGFDSYYTKEWLIEDFEFTQEEVDWLFAEVKRKSGGI